MSDRKIIISECVFGGRFIVSFEPRSIAWPSLEFRKLEDARACADARQKAHGWLVVDRTEADHG